MQKEIGESKYIDHNSPKVSGIRNLTLIWELANITPPFRMKGREKAGE